MEDDKIIKEYDDKRNMIHYKHPCGFESWREYDIDGNEIHYKESTGLEWWKEYDEYGNTIYHKGSNGYEWACEYNEDDTCYIRGWFKSYSYAFIYDRINHTVTSFSDSQGCTYDSNEDTHNNKIFVKGLHADMTGYKGFQYEIGKEYKIDSDELKLHSNTVFHFARSLYRVLDNYNDPTDRYFEIEVLGDIIEGDGVYGSNHIRILREIILSR